MINDYKESKTNEENKMGTDGSKLWEMIKKQNKTLAGIANGF